mmetsp:Transcript_33087/g.32213  ORF Transcript_33087/g.32213 Transcript_33087/m.32213 type:complete len:113 (+) Transcript_33087:884-1222(+)
MQYFDGLGFHHWHRPDAASALFFEFYRVRTALYVKMVYKVDLDTTETFKFPGQQEEFISFEDFRKNIEARYEDVKFEDLEKECGEEYVSDGDYFSAETTLNSLIELYGLNPL